MFVVLSTALVVLSFGHLGGNFWIVEHFERIHVGRPTNATVLIQDPEDVPLLWQDFEIVHEKKIHVVMARSDGRYLQHIHPEAPTDTSARLSLSLTFPTPGWYYVSYDFSPKKETKLLSALLVFKYDTDPVTGTLNLNESTRLCDELRVCPIYNTSAEITSADVHSLLLDDTDLEEGLWDVFQYEILHGGFSTRLFVPGETETDDREPNYDLSRSIHQCRGSDFTDETCETMWLLDGKSDSSDITAVLEGVEGPIKAGDCHLARVSLIKGAKAVSLRPYLSAAAHVYILPSDLQEYPQFEHIHANNGSHTSCTQTLPTNPKMTITSQDPFSHIFIPLNLSNYSTSSTRYVTMIIQAKLDCSSLQPEQVCTGSSNGVFTVSFDIEVGQGLLRRDCLCPEGGWIPLTDGKCGKITDKVGIRPLPPSEDGLCQEINENATLLNDPTAIQLSISGSLLRTQTGGIGYLASYLGWIAAISQNNSELRWPGSNTTVATSLLAPGYVFQPNPIAQCGYVGFTASGKVVAAACGYSLYHVCEIACEEEVIHTETPPPPPLVIDSEDRSGAMSLELVIVGLVLVIGAVSAVILVKRRGKNNESHHLGDAERYPSDSFADDNELSERESIHTNEET